VTTEKTVVPVAVDQFRLQMVEHERENLRKELRESGDRLARSSETAQRLLRELEEMKERTPRLTRAVVLDLATDHNEEPSSHTGTDHVDSLSAALDLERAAHSMTKRKLQDLRDSRQGREPPQTSTRRGAAVGSGKDQFEEGFPTPDLTGLPTPAIARRAPEIAALRNLLKLGFPGRKVGVIGIDYKETVRILNPAAERMTGWKERDAVGRSAAEVLVTSGEWSMFRVVPSPEPQIADDTSTTEHSSFLVNRRGHRLPVDICSVDLHDEIGERVGRAVFVLDNSEQRLLALQLARLSNHDTLTGLLNRGAFLGHVEQVLEKASMGIRDCVMCYIDLDHFRLVNDTCGHEAGDALLQWVSAILREGTSEPDVIGRLGGDEFGVLFLGRDVHAVGHLVRLIQKKFSMFKFAWDGAPLSVSASFGIVPLTNSMRSTADILLAADLACARAKSHGLGTAHVFREGDVGVEREVREMQRARTMANDLNIGKFVLFGQKIEPLQSTGTDKNNQLHFEVLLRLLDESRRPVSPVEVIRSAELYGGMATLDRWVIRQTLKLLKAQPQELVRRIGMCSINLSGLSFRSNDLLEYIHEQLADSGIPAAKLCFEITETVAIGNLKRAGWLIDGLRAIGCRFALDDFGTGFASYGHLRDLPVDIIKIDSMFMKDLGEQTLNRAIVESVNQISHFLGMLTIAEGVGSDMAFEEVARLGLDYGQGYAIGHPKPLAELLADHLDGEMRVSRVHHSQPPPAGLRRRASGTHLRVTAPLQGEE
jgi:diguanylate cyclase (GGDEF)-like protein/PAS domain S-box-containing protein